MPKRDQGFDAATMGRKEFLPDTDRDESAPSENIADYVMPPRDIIVRSLREARKDLQTIRNREAGTAF